ncbi:integral membrane protein [Colletotrichum tofieldiae]|uniref:Integral membrane protein n=1 Tax=Colletotrichum tofieldiae TaxID=708197 RepID=A0A166WBZ7_9PEZI|nr:integral membrane protein [Colletotrichum tofieldiae]
MTNSTMLLATSCPTPSRCLPHDTKQPIAIGLASVFIGIVTVFVAIRVYIRGYILRALGLDDLMFVWSSVLYGALGAHIWDLTFRQLQAGVHYSVSFILVYQVAFFFIKATFLLQYRRAFALPYIKRICDVFLGLLFLVLSAMLISGGLILRQFLGPVVIPAKGGILVWGYTNASVHLVTNVVVFIFPITLVYQLRLATIQKVGLIFSFGVGVFTCAISILRIVSLQSATDTIDQSYQSTTILLLSIAEPTSAAVCVCVPLLRPLLMCSTTSRPGTHGSRKPLSAVTNDSGGQTDLAPSMPLASPTSLKRLQMA